MLGTEVHRVRWGRPFIAPLPVHSQLPPMALGSLVAFGTWASES